MEHFCTILIIHSSLVTSVCQKAKAVVYAGFYLLGVGLGWGRFHPKLRIIIVLLPNSVYSSVQNSCHECGLRRENGCGQPETFLCGISFPPPPPPSQNLYIEPSYGISFPCLYAFYSVDDLNCWTGSICTWILDGAMPNLAISGAREKTLWFFHGLQATSTSKE